MRPLILGLCLLVIGMQASCTPRPGGRSTASVGANAEREILALSRDKWRWMAERDVGRLTTLFHEQARFVHMSGTWGTDEEIEIIRSGSIHYRQADVHEAVVEIVGDVAIAWNRITLHAVVRGSEATNPFTVTEVYKRQDDRWKLLALTFSTVRPEHRIAP
jgi:ketosteroid isomerase-like protein